MLTSFLIKKQVKARNHKKVFKFSEKISVLNDIYSYLKHVLIFTCNIVVRAADYGFTTFFLCTFVPIFSRSSFHKFNMIQA